MLLDTGRHAEMRLMMSDAFINGVASDHPTSKLSEKDREVIMNPYGPLRLKLIHLRALRISLESYLTIQQQNKSPQMDNLSLNVSLRDFYLAAFMTWIDSIHIHPAAGYQLLRHGYNFGYILLLHGEGLKYKMRLLPRYPGRRKTGHSSIECDNISNIKRDSTIFYSRHASAKPCHMRLKW